MEPIPLETVSKSLQHMKAGSPEKTLIVQMKKISREQPHLLSFVLQHFNGMNEEVRQFGMYIFIMIHKIFCDGYEPDIPMVSLGETREFYESNEIFLGRMRSGQLGMPDRVSNFYVSPQPSLIKYLTEMLTEQSPSEDGRALSENEVMCLFLTLKTVIDVLNQKTSDLPSSHHMVNTTCQ